MSTMPIDPAWFVQRQDTLSQGLLKDPHVAPPAVEMPAVPPLPDIPLPKTT